MGDQLGAIKEAISEISENDELYEGLDLVVMGTSMNRVVAETFIDDAIEIPDLESGGRQTIDSTATAASGPINSPSTLLSANSFSRHACNRAPPRRHSEEKQKEIRKQCGTAQESVYETVLNVLRSLFQCVHDTLNKWRLLK